MNDMTETSMQMRIDQLQAELERERAGAASLLREHNHLVQAIGSPTQGEAAHCASRMRLNLKQALEELKQERAKSNRLAEVLTSIHALLYPPVITLANGQTLNFVPKSLDPHALMQELSDRIRAIPDELGEMDSNDGDDEGIGELARRPPWELKPGAEVSLHTLEQMRHLIDPERWQEIAARSARVPP